jgi:single-stranded DNA-binding protein
MPALVSGELQIRKCIDKNNTERTSVEVRADKMKLLDSKAKQERDLAAETHTEGKITPYSTELVKRQFDSWLPFTSISSRTKT